LVNTPSSCGKSPVKIDERGAAQRIGDEVLVERRPCVLERDHVRHVLRRDEIPREVICEDEDHVRAGRPGLGAGGRHQPGERQRTDKPHREAELG
jgi:hypothetical protein